MLARSSCVALFCTLSCIGLLPRAAAAAPAVYLAGGTGAAVQHQRGPHVYGRVVVDGPRLGVEAGAREGALGVGDDLVQGGLADSDGSFVGAISVLGRVPVGPVVLRAGLAHHHETPAPVVVADPGGALAGVSDGIHHRSGFEAGVEGVLPASRLLADPGALAERTELTAGLTVDWMTGAHDHSGDHGGHDHSAASAWTGWAEVGVRVRLGATAGG